MRPRRASINEAGGVSVAVCDHADVTMSYRQWDMDVLKDFVIGRMLWDPTLSPEALIAQFLRGLRGLLGLVPRLVWSSEWMYITIPC